jgi:hypothetical protein
VNLLSDNPKRLDNLTYTTQFKPHSLLLWGFFVFNQGSVKGVKGLKGLNQLRGGRPP